MEVEQTKDLGATSSKRHEETVPILCSASSACQTHLELDGLQQLLTTRPRPIGRLGELPQYSRSVVVPPRLCHQELCSHRRLRHPVFSSCLVTKRSQVRRQDVQGLELCRCHEPRSSAAACSSSLVAPPL